MLKNLNIFDSIFDKDYLIYDNLDFDISCDGHMIGISVELPLLVKTLISNFQTFVLKSGSQKFCRASRALIH